MARCVAGKPRPRISPAQPGQVAPGRITRNGAIEQGLPGLAKRDFFLKPPPNTRANLRSEATVRTLSSTKLSYVIDWDLIYIGEGKQIHLDDPFVHDVRTLHSFKTNDHH